MKISANIYVCSKPLQYFNVLNLPRDEKQNNILIIEDKFKDSKDFYEKVKMFDRSWNEVIWVNDRSKVFFLCLLKFKVNNVYYYLDFMLRAASMLYALPCRNIFVYEEGISAYRTDIFSNTAGYKRKIRKLLGLSEFAGLHPKTKGIYVYDKEKYLKTFSQFVSRDILKPLSFMYPFPEMIDKNLQLAIKIFQFNPDKLLADVSGKKTLLYITSWPFNTNFLEHINSDDYDFIVIKPHPHIRNLSLPEHLRNDKMIIIDSVIPAEFLIRILMNRNNKTDIYHYNSSAAMYIDEIPGKLSIIRLKSRESFHNPHTVS